MSNLLTLVMERLEDRVLFDAIPDASLTQPEAPAISEPQVGHHQDQQELATESTPIGVLVFDRSVMDTNRQIRRFQALYPDVAFEIHLLNDVESGVDQFDDVLQNLSEGTGSIHLVTEVGDDGFRLGDQWFNHQSLADAADRVAEWGNWLSTNPSGSEVQLWLVADNQSDISGSDDTPALATLLESISGQMGKSLALQTLNWADDHAVNQPAVQYSEIIFVDAAIGGYEQLVTELLQNHDAEVVLLDSASDGVLQIAAALQGRTGIEAIHIVSHGTEGSLFLGSAVLDADSMQNQHLEALLAIGAALSDDGDLLIYGCNFTGGEAGLRAAIILGGITGADIASSSDLTGHEALGGNWNLETHVGAIEAASLAAPYWRGLLAEPVNILPLVLAVNEDTELTFSGAAAIGINDPDNSLEPLAIFNFQVSVIDGTFLAVDTTTGAAAGTTIIAGGLNSNTLTLSGTMAQVNAALATLVYRGNPTFHGEDTLTLVTTDVADGFTVTDEIIITVIPVNDVPVNTVSSAQTVAEDTTLAFNLANGNLISVTDVEGISTTQLTATDGTLNLSDLSGASIVAGANNSTTLTLSGSEAQINDALATLSFTGNLNFAGAATLTVLTTDKQGATATDLVTITVAQVNDPPVNVIPLVLRVNEDTNLTFSSANAIGFTDPEGAIEPLTTFTRQVSVLNGTFTNVDTTTGAAAGTTIIAGGLNSPARWPRSTPPWPPWFIEEISISTARIFSLWSQPTWRVVSRFPTRSSSLSCPLTMRPSTPYRVPRASMKTQLWHSTSPTATVSVLPTWKVSLPRV
jgi:hypothetical protein